MDQVLAVASKLDHHLGEVERLFLTNVVPLLPSSVVEGNDKFWKWALEPYTTGDRRVDGWFLANNYRLPAFISFLYLAGIFVGTLVMKRRKEPFALKTVSLLHNLVLFSLSIYMVVETALAAYDNFGWARKFRPFCNPVDAPRGGGFTPSGARLANVLYVHYLSKAYEFVDTFIAIGKKNFRQVSFLHVYHHVTTFFPVWYLVIRNGPGGEAYFCSFLNSFIHVWMYGYYLLSSLAGKEGGFRRALNSFKPMITYMQMTQFLLFIFQGAYLLGTECFRPRIQPVLLLFQCVIFFALFFNFAVQNYWKPKGAAAKGAGKKND